MISIIEYFNNKIDSASDEQKANAATLLVHVNALLARYISATGNTLPISPDTRSNISGNRNGDGGFRLSDSKTGASKSSHKEGKGIDIYDPIGELDKWLFDDVLEKCGLYREHPVKTPRWCHLTTRAPGSGHRTFYP